MENNNFCQSCSMLLDKPELLGTEKDGSKNKEYCSYCYQKGSFTTPNITLGEMQAMVKQQMGKMKMDTSIIDMAVSTVPNLKRWKN
jgi:predicted amidophosphoribosyltransferase